MVVCNNLPKSLKQTSAKENRNCDSQGDVAYGSQNVSIAVNYSLDLGPISHDPALVFRVS